MTEGEAVAISQADIEATGRKLEDLYHQLPANEQAVLGWLLQRAESAGPAEPASGEVQGYVSGVYSYGGWAAGGNLYGALGLSSLFGGNSAAARPLGQRSIIIVGG
jgi:hypothetical protein